MFFFPGYHSFYRNKWSFVAK